MKNYFAIATILAAALGFSTTSMAAGAGAYAFMEPEQGWPHDKLIGARYDRAAAQRGFQVYKEVCASCHGLDLVAFRTLGDIGFSEAEVKAIAAEYMVMGEPNEEGDVEERAALAFDRFPSPYPNTQAAAYANNGAVPPDLSLMAKARFGGAAYIYSLMLGYGEPTEEDLKHVPGGAVPDTAYFNKYKSGYVIAMAPPLSEGIIEFSEGQPEATLEQMSYDIATFLAWTAEPKLEERNSIGFLFMTLLLILCGLLFFTYRRISKRVLGH